MRLNSTPINRTWCIFMVFQILVEFTFAVTAQKFKLPWDWNWRKPKPPSIASKIGTVDQYIETYTVFLNTTYKDNLKFGEKLVTALRKNALPPKKHAVFSYKSRFLGLLAVQVSMAPHSREVVKTIVESEEFKSGVSFNWLAPLQFSRNRYRS